MSNERIFIVEDEPLVFGMLVTTLESDPATYEVSGAMSGRGILKKLRAFRPHCVVLDLGLGPGPDGMEILTGIRRDAVLRDVAVLVVTGRLPVGHEHRAIEVGADSCFNKSGLTPQVLRENVAALLQRVRARRADRVRVGPLTLSRKDRRTWVGDEAVDFSAAEFDILDRMARKPERLHAPGELLRLGGDPHALAARRLLKVHISRIRHKLGSHASMVETVRGRGYRLRFSRDDA